MGVVVGSWIVECSIDNQFDRGHNIRNVYGISKVAHGKAINIIKDVYVRKTKFRQTSNMD